MHLSAGSHIPAGAAHRGRFEVDGVQLGPFQRCDERGPHRARSAAQVDDDGSWPGQGGGLADEELGARAGYEDFWVHGYPQAAELSPAEDVLEGQAGGLPIHNRGEVGGASVPWR